METYRGYVRTPADAIKLFEACRLGLLPRVQRRLSEKERQSITSGSVFVWDEREAGMRRWTDGKSWSASRVSGSFLTYREMEGKRGTTFGTTRRSNGRTPDSGRLSEEDQDGEPEGYRYKADGLMKQSFSITTSQGQHLHLISYYSRPHAGAGDLLQPTTDPQLRHIIPAKGLYPESSLHETNPPALTRAPMQPYNTHNGGHEQTPYNNYLGAWNPPAWQGQWPPSPNHTPPFMHGKLTPEINPQSRPQPQPPPQRPQLPPLPPTSAPSAQAPIYPKGLTYESDRLPPPSLVRPYSVPGRAPSLSPQSQQLQLQAAQAAHAAQTAKVAQAVQAAQAVIDPRLAATSARNPQGPLPAIPAASRGLTPPRNHSVSPPRQMTLESGNGNANKASLSALLNRTPANSEPNSANPCSNNSAGSSPRALPAGASGVPVTADMFRGEDNRAIQSLNRKFYL
ncbi:Gti1/Pac2 family-domain-containing protein [Daldinia caldariorum]|uniref:Gti1/Pac2 family-domain-containing protein n=1 Tax=Daldinia caldariorum TaxID=326644 RepID=UPI002007C055|nr:Gti1/Pac2 family-domain-containing protein [Daldinia caldariorum]KAI1464826.1 Gti1/Pac2 family-domain-containing protein [Daldinia caldariorum]